MAYHPLLTEDTGTQGAGKRQIEVSVDATRDRASASRSTQTNLIATYGLTPKVDVQLGTSHVRHESRDTSLELKWQVLEADGWTMALKPGVTVATGGRANYGAVAVVGYESGGWEFYGHLGARRNRNTRGERGALYQVSASTIWEARERFWLVAEAGVLRQPDPAVRSQPEFLGVGLIWGPTKDLDLDLGWRRGVNATASERTLDAGITLRW